MDMKRYLKRINSEASGPADLNLLTLLQNNHLESIPFENLNIKRKIPITLDVEKFYAKVVDGFRGGFCYELNGLFKELLDSLGYKTQFISCTVLKPDGTWTIPESHVAIVAFLEDGKYLVDVGFGDSARKPLPFSGDVRSDISGSYRIQMHNDSLYNMEKLQQGTWVTKYRFSLEEKQLEDFTFACNFHQSSPRSIFTQGDIVTIATPTGRITMTDMAVTFTESDTKIRQDLSENEKNVLFEEKFGIRI